jgi:hypothetical protein
VDDAVAKSETAAADDAAATNRGNRLAYAASSYFTARAIVVLVVIFESSKHFVRLGIATEAVYRKLVGNSAAKEKTKWNSDKTIDAAT